MSVRSRPSERRHYVGPWRIDVTIRPGVSSPLPIVSVVRAAAAALDAANAPGRASLGIILSDDHELAALNAEHMGEAGPTDVLSFPLLPAQAFAPGGPPSARSDQPEFVLPPGRRVHLGDIVVSVERAIAQARDGRGGQTGDLRWSPTDELRLLVTHGTLHICGMDHAGHADEAAMRALEARLLEGG